MIAGAIVSTTSPNVVYWINAATFLFSALLLAPGQYVNLGMGIPTKVANYITAESGVMLHAENGILGYGPQPTEDEFQWQYFNAQGQPVRPTA